MEDLYKELGFETPKFIENPYGIKIYLGTKDKEDWCVEIPKGLAKLKSSSYNLKCNCVLYLISEEDALRIAREFTLLAKQFDNHIKLLF